MEYSSQGEQDRGIVEPAVSVRDLAYTYRGQKDPALDGVSLEVARGEFVVVMGHSGAGKSTLCTSLNGLIPHFFRGRMQGEVLVEGRSTREGKVGEFAKEVGLVFQDFEAQLFSTNVALEVAFGPENFEVEREEMVRRVETVLGQVRLEGFEGRQPATLSGGQKQRLAIASVLAMEPRILGNVPFTVLASIISINNAIVGVVLGPILLLVLYPRVKRWGLLWTEIMNPEEVPASRFQSVGNVLMWVGGMGGLI